MSNFQEQSDVPEHWQETKLGEVVDILDSERDPINSTERQKRLENSDEKYPYYGATGQVGWIDDYLFDEELVLLGEDGAPFLEGFRDVAYIVNGKTWVNNHAHVLRAHEELITNRFLMHYLNTVDYHDYVTGTTRLKLNQGRMREIPVYLPPLPEQRRIVAKIEELFSNLDAGMDDLQAAGQQLERYRLSVLQAAVEGRLTADWRRTHDPKPADQLLERILEERRKQWERDYREKYRKKERDLPSGWKSRYSEAEEPETEELEELSKGWTWTSLDQLLSNMRNGYSKAPKADDGVPILRISSVRPLSVNLDDVRYLEGKSDDYEKYLIEPGYLLFIRYNGNPGLVGACGAVPALDQPYAHPDKLIRGEVADHETVMPSYLEIALNMGPSREHIQNRVRTTAGQAGISQGDLYSCPVPVPPPAEQKQIVDEVERLLSVADDAAATAEREHTRAERLRQSILKQAFSGRLVPHDEDATSPAIELSPTDGSPSSASGDTGSSTEEDSSGEDDVVAKDLYNGRDPGKQIEMDL